MYVCISSYVRTYMTSTRNAYETCERVPRRDDTAGTTRDRDLHAAFRTTRTSASGPTRTGTGPDLGKFLPTDRRARGTRAERWRGDMRGRSSSDTAIVYRSKYKQKDRFLFSCKTVSEQRKQKNRVKTPGNIVCILSLSRTDRNFSSPVAIVDRSLFIDFSTLTVSVTSDVRRSVTNSRADRSTPYNSESRN